MRRPQHCFTRCARKRRFRISNIEASNFGRNVDVEVKRTPTSGPALPLTVATIPNGATVTLPLDFPPNVPVTVNVWSR